MQCTAGTARHCEGDYFSCSVPQGDAERKELIIIISVLNELFKPYLQKESAIVWLSDRLCPQPIATFRKGGPFSQNTLEETLMAGGFARVEKTASVDDGGISIIGVSGPGDFSIDDGTIDVWPYGSGSPFRVIFSDGKVDSICSFDPSSQEPVRDGDFLEVFRHGDQEGRIDRMAVYHTSIASSLIMEGNDIIGRYPVDVLDGLRAGGATLVEAAFLLRCCRGAAKSLSEGDETGLDNAYEHFVEDWAIKTGVWIDDPEGFFYNDALLLSDRGRSVVFRKGDDVYKVRGVERSIVEEIDAIAVFNSLFPSMAMTVEKFGRNRRGVISLVVKQRFVDGASPSVEEIRTALATAGLRKVADVDSAGFANGDVLVEEIRAEDFVAEGRRVLAWSLGRARLNTVKLGKGGTWKIAAPKADDDAVGRIGDVLEKLVPDEVDKAAFLKKYENKTNMLSSQLNVTGRFDGYVTERHVSGGETNYAVAADAADSESLLRMDCKKISAMLQDNVVIPEKELHEICYGFGMWIGDDFVAFDVASGHLRKALPYLDTLRNDLFVSEQSKIIQGLSAEQAEKKSKGKGKGRRSG